MNGQVGWNIFGFLRQKANLPAGLPISGKIHFYTNSKNVLSLFLLSHSTLLRVHYFTTLVKYSALTEEGFA